MIVLTKLGRNIQLLMHSMLRNIMYACCLIAIACAHKAAPLFKDRMNPSLTNVSSLNNRHVLCIFSEPIDTLNLQSDFFTIAAGQDTLQILALYPSLSSSEIIAVTEPQTDTAYEFSGYVFDLNENQGFFKSSFTGTSSPDTIQPWIVQYSQGGKTGRFRLFFSEMMDTSYFTFFTAPNLTLSVTWENVRACRLEPDSALHPDTTYYLLITDGVRDISENITKSFVTSITPDTAYRPLLLEGTVMVNDTFAAYGIAVLRKHVAVGFALVESGTFTFEVRDSTHYMVDILTGPYTGSGTVAVGDENVITLEPQEKNLDNIIH
ncbi:MAG: hypothetical protein JSW02_00985 [candidate division WOR-3 bacterium]|nr:MAG: hypothetical protein JSW02_00985 [candidate division WOR-3 bacterium]